MAHLLHYTLYWCKRQKSWLNLSFLKKDTWLKIPKVNYNNTFISNVALSTFTEKGKRQWHKEYTEGKVWSQAWWRQEVFYSLLSSPEKHSKKKKRPKQKFLCRRMPDKLDEGHRGHHTGAMWDKRWVLIRDCSQEDGKTFWVSDRLTSI